MNVPVIVDPKLARVVRPVDALVFDPEQARITGAVDGIILDPKLTRMLRPVNTVIPNMIPCSHATPPLLASTETVDGGSIPWP